MTRPSLRAAKQNLRKSILELCNNQAEKDIVQKSKQVTENLLEMDEYKRAKVVMLYSGKDKEVRTEQLIRTALQEKRVVLPITNVKKRILEMSELKDYDLELELGTFSILEPKKEYIRSIELDAIDLIVLPGVGFDLRGNRLGYGYAYYDKLLNRFQKPTPFIGLAFQFQVQPNVPYSQYDIPVHYIVTEQEIIKCG